MKRIDLCRLGCGVMLLFGAGCSRMASQPPPPDLGWPTSLPDALALAQKENKLVLLNFTGSDWCPACEQLDADILSKKEFSEYASTNLELVEVDFPVRRKLPDALAKANQDLCDKYGIRGYPTLIALKADGQGVWTNYGIPEGGLVTLLARLDEVKKK